MLSRETPRLLLRPPTVEDLEPFVEIHEDPEVMRYMTVIGPLSGRVAAWKLLAVMIGHWHLRGYGQWTVVERATGLVLGRVGLWNPEGWPGIEVGWLIRRSHWGHGFATEAAKEAIDFGFHHVGADHLISIIRRDNARSIRVAEKLGETFERALRFEGAESFIYGITKG